MGAPRFRLWMWLTLGSVLVLGLSAGLLADRFLMERGGGKTKGMAGSRDHAARPPMFLFDCQAWEESVTAAAADPGRAPETEAPPPPDRHREHSTRATDRLAHRLELDSGQTEALQAIVETAMVRSRRYWVTARDDFCAMQQEFHRNVSEMLQPEQATRFEEWRRELADRSRHHGGRHRGARSSDGTESGGCR